MRSGCVRLTLILLLLCIQFGSGLIGCAVNRESCTREASDVPKRRPVGLDSTAVEFTLGRRAVTPQQRIGKVTSIDGPLTGQIVLPTGNKLPLESDTVRLYWSNDGSELVGIEWRAANFARSARETAADLQGWLTRQGLLDGFTRSRIASSVNFSGPTPMRGIGGTVIVEEGVSLWYEMRRAHGGEYYYVLELRQSQAPPSFGGNKSVSPAPIGGRQGEGKGTILIGEPITSSTLLLLPSNWEALADHRGLKRLTLKAKPGFILVHTRAMDRPVFGFSSEDWFIDLEKINADWIVEGITLQRTQVSDHQEAVMMIRAAFADSTSALRRWAGRRVFDSEGDQSRRLYDHFFEHLRMTFELVPMPTQQSWRLVITARISK